MKKLILLCSLITACASSSPLDRSESSERFGQRERENLRASLTRSELSAKLATLESQISAIDSQIKTQNGVIRNWRDQNVASSRAMIENAQLKIEQLKMERDFLVRERNAIAEELKSI